MILKTAVWWRQKNRSHFGFFIFVSYVCLDLHRDGATIAELPHFGWIWMAQFTCVGFLNIGKNCSPLLNLKKSLFVHLWSDDLTLSYIYIFHNRSSAPYTSFNFHSFHSIMANSTWHYFYFPLLIALIFLCFSCDNVKSQIETKPWYETLPAVAMDYKVHIDAGKEDCYYQYVQAGATFYVSFQVSKKAGAKLSVRLMYVFVKSLNKCRLAEFVSCAFTEILSNNIRYCWNDAVCGKIRNVREIFVYQKSGSSLL